MKDKNISDEKAEEVYIDKRRSARELADLLFDSVFIISGEGRFLYVNRTGIDTLGYSLEEFLNEIEFKDIFSKVDITSNTAINEILAGETYSGELNFYSKDGRQLTGKTHSNPIMENNMLSGIWVIIRDITARKNTEAMLRYSEERYKRITGTITDYIYTVHIKNGRPIETIHNSACEVITGYTAEEFSSNPFLWIQMVPEKDRKKVEAHAAKILTDEETQPIEHRIVRKDGASLWVRNTPVPHFNDQGELIFYDGLIKDITERRRAEDALRESEEKYRSILETIEEGYYEIDLAGNFVFFNKSLCKISGYSEDELMGMNYRRYIDRKSVKKVYETYIDVYQTGKPFKAFDWEIIRKDGTKRFVEASILLKRGVLGTPVGFRGIVRDITDRIVAEDALRESEEKYRNILRNIEEGYYEVDIKGSFTFFNESLCKILGYHKHEMREMNYHEYMDRETARAVFRAFNKVYKTGEPHKAFDWEIKRKDGSRRYVEASVSPIYNSGGNTVGFSGILRDITRRKQMEEKLKRTLEVVHSLSLTDELTGLYNRRGFTTLAQQQLKVSHRIDEEIILLFADIDNMKWINDNCGHSEGDKALIAVAGVLKKTFRESDIIARIGGDEFAVLAVETSVASSDTILKRLNKNVENFNRKGDKDYNLSISTGISRYDSKNSLSINDLLADADSRMYEQKRNKQKPE